MNKKKILLAAVFVGFVVLVLNIWAMKTSLYYIFWWFDMPMHFLGGFWSGLLVFALMQRRSVLPLQKTQKNLLVFLIGVLAVGVLWEAYEYVVQIFTIVEIARVTDSVSDLFFDMAGGITAFIIYQKKVYA